MWLPHWPITRLSRSVSASLDRPLVTAEAVRGVRNLVAVLIDHRRLPFLSRVIDQLEKELDARLGFTEAQMMSARELGASEKKVLESQIAKTSGKKVRATYSLDPSLLGGAVVRIGSTIYDGSVKGQLERIKEAISS